jgi:tetratricopeptide (TPR) repeat protein
MLKKAFLMIIAASISLIAHAQSADSVFNQYADFNLARFQGEQEKVLELGEKILPNAGKLPEKTRINFYFSVGKMYDDDGQPNKALTYYELVAAAAPDYYVVHRALGYLYADKANAIETKLNASTGDKAAKDTLTAVYIKAVQKALPHLEKAQACDPSDETLEIIKTFYNKINDPQGFNSLGDRLKQFSKNCIDILGDN